MIEGYQRRIRPAQIAFREVYALTWNQFQIEHIKTPELIQPQDVLRFPGESKRREPRAKPTWTLDRINQVIASEGSSSPPET